MLLIPKVSVRSLHFCTPLLWQCWVNIWTGGFYRSLPTKTILCFCDDALETETIATKPVHAQKPNQLHPVHVQPTASFSTTMVHDMAVVCFWRRQSTILNQAQGFALTQGCYPAEKDPWELGLNICCDTFMSEMVLCLSGLYPTGKCPLFARAGTA